MTAKTTYDSGEMYEVFGRTNIKRSLMHLGSVRANNEKLAVALARMVYSERPWVELRVAPTVAFLSCLDPEERGCIGMA